MSKDNRSFQLKLCEITLSNFSWVSVFSCSISFGNKWTASSEFGTYRLCEQRRFRRACAFAQSRQNLRCSLIQAVNQEELSDRKPDPWPLWMAGHAQLKFVMTECSKTQIRLTGLKWFNFGILTLSLWKTGMIPNLFWPVYKGPGAR